MHFNLVLVCFEKLVYNTQLVKVLFRYHLVFITRYCFKKQHQLKSKEKKPCRKCAIITIANNEASTFCQTILLFRDGGLCHIETSLSVCCGNQWIGFCIYPAYLGLCQASMMKFFCKYSYCISYRNQSFVQLCRTNDLFLYEIQ